MPEIEAKYAIYNIAAQLIKSETLEMSVSSLIKWDGKNELGNTVSSGIYFIRVEVKAVNGKMREQRSQKIVLLK